MFSFSFSLFDEEITWGYFRIQVGVYFPGEQSRLFTEQVWIRDEQSILEGFPARVHEKDF